MDQREIEKLLSRPTISVSQAGAVVGLSRNSAYEAASRGELPIVRFGRSIKVLTAPLRKKLGLDGAPAPSNQPTAAGKKKRPRSRRGR